MKLSYTGVIDTANRFTIDVALQADPPAIILPTGETLDALSWMLLRYQIEQATPEETDLLWRALVANPRPPKPKSAL